MNAFVLRVSQGAAVLPHDAVTRREIEAQVEELIARLDEMDGNCDGEPDGDGEPWLGWSASMAHGVADDREQDAGDEGEAADDDAA